MKERRAGWGEYLSSAAALRWTVGLLLLAVAVGIYFRFREQLTLDYVYQQEGQLREYQRDHPGVLLLAAFAFYVTYTTLALPGGPFLAIACGWLFGFWRGLVLVSFASTAGAIFSFLIGRYLLREPIQQRYGEQLEATNNALRKQGWLYLFILRLTPATPFFLLNIVFGVTPMRVRTFWWVSQLGTLPATAICVYAGAAVPDLRQVQEHGPLAFVDWRLIVALVLLVIFPVVTTVVVRWWGRKTD